MANSGEFRDGQTDDVELAYTGIEGANVRSVTMWVRVTGLPQVSGTRLVEAANGTLCYWGQDSGDVPASGSAWSIELKNGKPRLWIRDGHVTISKGEPQCQRIVDNGEWKYVAAVFDGSEGNQVSGARLYVDKYGPMPLTVVGGTTTVNTISGSNVVIGARNIGSAKDAHLRGNIRVDEFAVFSTALTTTQVMFIYNNGMDGRDQTALPGVPVPDVWLTMGDGSDDEVTFFDISGSGRDGTVSGVIIATDSPVSVSG